MRARDYHRLGELLIDVSSDNALDEVKSQKVIDECDNQALADFLTWFYTNSEGTVVVAHKDVHT